jgi:hypothetical protein
MVKQLTLGLHGGANDGFYTVDEFWDCECGENYIHLKNNDGTRNVCPVCHIDEEEDGYPDSRLIEVLEKYPELNDVPWVMRDGTPADKDAVRALWDRYLASIP